MSAQWYEQWDTDSLIEIIKLASNPDPHIKSLGLKMLFNYAMWVRDLTNIYPIEGERLYKKISIIYNRISRLTNPIDSQESLNNFLSNLDS